MTYCVQTSREPTSATMVAMMSRNTTANQPDADPHAIAIAEAVQAAVQLDTVILF